MYFTSKHIGVKSNQDYSDFFENGLVICDGIGSYKQSGEVAKIVVDKFIENINSNDFNINEFVNSIPPILKEKNIKGGTTFISALVNSNSIIFYYLGNGGIIHLKGDFYENRVTDIPYRYIELMNPDINASGALTRHISDNSGEIELSLTKVTVEPNSINGDIFLLFSDGIGTLEEHVIVKDANNNLWRNEPAAIEKIINEIHVFLTKECKSEDFNNKLILFNANILESIKDLLEDDASLGIIITEKVLNYYKKL